MKNNSSFQTPKCSLVLAFLGFVFLLTGCGTVPVQVTRGPLPSSSSRRQAAFAVASFKDTRPVEKKVAIGIVKSGFGNRLGDIVVKNGRPIEIVMQSFFEDALRQIGYEIIPPDRAEVIVEGEVFDWWLDGNWNIVNRIGVLVRVRDRERGTVLWEKEIRGQEDDMISPKNAVRAAVDVSLANAIREFSSLDFFQAVQRRSRRALDQ